MTEEKKDDDKNQDKAGGDTRAADAGVSTPTRDEGGNAAKPDDAGNACDRDGIKDAIKSKIEKAGLEAEIAELEKLLEAIEKAEKSYDEKHPGLMEKQNSLAEFKASSLARIRASDGGNLSDSEIARIKEIVTEAVAEVSVLEKELVELKGVVPKTVEDEGKFKFGKVETARIRLDAAKKEHEAAAAKLKQLGDPAGSIAARQAKLDKMAAEISKRIAGPREIATFGTAWWLIAGGGVPDALAGDGFFKGLLEGDPRMIDPECLARDIETAWRDEAAKKATVYRLTSDLQKAESRLKDVEKNLADARTKLIKKIIKEIEAWDCIRPGFPNNVKEC